MCKYLFQVFQHQAKYELKKKISGDIFHDGNIFPIHKYGYVLCFVKHGFYFTCVIADKHSEVAWCKVIS